MRRSLGLILLLLVAAAPARADVACLVQASGVSGVIADQKDVIGAVNCLGQQLARLRNDATVSERATAARIDDLARQIAALQSAVNVLAKRVGALEANIVDSETPLAKRPW
ncbi:hypothetical protein OGR47_06335 [Methylocystis sp. MJC1]|jgi:hypothetical protein|uniref:hypothetical protein n=1 Tax=Methylocystis sp. MJC1 TaxID=2654282 RepID=UPI0013E9E3BF|nr:hypothetical protein [Methylocystis sp. MJC1]KAF2992651.1 hypothetical protein MJC1_00229 [Methylocystis sp. MJC1]MBU6526617.1 hypothetical protein [Methylocystis sp. MJC1]UZX13060.1 hypothetical protein OGR47_06335 [Methylocystis sp. MJC1]